MDMVIQSILQVMGLSDPEVTQLVNGTDCGLTGGQEPATWCSLRKGEVGGSDPSGLFAVEIK